MLLAVVVSGAQLYASRSGPLVGAHSSSVSLSFDFRLVLAPGISTTSVVVSPGPRQALGPVEGVALHLDPVPRGTSR
ncbi:MAG: hypothetical protein EVA79_01130 [Prochlorococcus sp. MED-G132]|uniref:hypothetical protein n=1 Tax=Prochlorococcus sp. MIT 1306 TaxID=1799667 RepID=UPI0007B3462F|nr:hypothetical protein [Prochlorococcus sp. MIT 1306]RZO52273.1 MAG: hypothetical protein EVA79_01130 [Prochlorococcus sp. MED-G132]